MQYTTIASRPYDCNLEALWKKLLNTPSPQRPPIKAHLLVSYHDADEANRRMGKGMLECSICIGWAGAKLNLMVWRDLVDKDWTLMKDVFNAE